MRASSRLTDLFTTLLRVLIVLNILIAVGFLIALITTLPIDSGNLARLAAKFGPGVDSAAALNGIRIMLVVGLLAVAIAHVTLRTLRDIVVTVRAGDPFIGTNAARIRTIGFTLLALQTLDLVFGALDYGLAATGFETGGWVPSMTGWLAALAAFVLAEVFARGAAMRDDLSGTV